MKTVQCGRCDAKIDIQDGLMIDVCYSPVDKKRSYRGHSVIVDVSSQRGAAIKDYIEKKPVPVLK
jgi:hypothetical protein